MGLFRRAAIGPVEVTEAQALGFRWHDERRRGSPLAVAVGVGVNVAVAVGVNVAVAVGVNVAVAVGVNVAVAVGVNVAVAVGVEVGVPVGVAVGTPQSTIEEPSSTPGGRGPKEV